MKRKLFYSICFCFLPVFFTATLVFAEITPSDVSDNDDVLSDKSEQSVDLTAEKTDGDTQAVENPETNGAQKSDDDHKPVKRVRITHTADKNTQPLHAGMRLFDRLDPFSEKKETGYWDLAWHARLADYGDHNSQFIIAQAYEQGKHTVRNPEKSLYFYKTAAQGGHDQAAIRLGQIFEKGIFGKTDINQALFWYDQACVKESVPALLAASNICQNEAIMDYEKSYQYLSKAMRILFPNVQNLETVAPDLIRIKQQILPAKLKKIRLQMNNEVMLLEKRVDQLTSDMDQAVEASNDFYEDILSVVTDSAELIPDLGVLDSESNDVFLDGDDPVEFLTHRLLVEQKIQERESDDAF